MSFEKIDRQAVIVWLYTLKNTRQLQRFGHIHYMSRKMRYAVIYVNQDEIDLVVSELEQLPYVREVEVSHQHEMDLTFSDVFEGQHYDFLAENRAKTQEHSLDEIAAQIRKGQKDARH